MGMTILLVLSFINACWNIFRSIVMYVTTPRMAEMLDSGAFEEMMQPFSAMGEDFIKSMNDTISILTQVNPNYYLILMALFVVSLVGVRRMFKNDKRGFHFYSISQICMLIAHSVYVYRCKSPRRSLPTCFSRPFSFCFITSISSGWIWQTTFLKTMIEHGTARRKDI